MGGVIEGTSEGMLVAGWLCVLSKSFNLDVRIPSPKIIGFMATSTHH